MRISEIFESAAPNIPAKYMIDPDTDLALNLPNQWSESPYLGAVKAPGGYRAQIHIPQDVWTAMVDQNPSKWRNAPEGFFNSVGNQRPSMRVKFSDPRQAAWFAQEVLYGGEHPARDYIEDYFDQMYNGGQGELWKNLARSAPSYSGQPLSSSDEEKFFASRDDHKKQITAQQNSKEYETKMPQRIKQALVDFYTKNKALAKKRLGNISNPSQLNQVIDQLIQKLGIDYFVTQPGSVKLKDIASLKFS